MVTARTPRTKFDPDTMRSSNVTRLLIITVLLASALAYGWISSQERIYQDNTHVTLWHVNDSALAGANEGFEFWIW